jgi:hypothetical protein
MYNTEFANARDNSAGQTNSGLGASHPTGYATGQFWSTTAQQWNAMWGTEWRNSHDPQGYSFSYPGQGANAVYWSQSAQYWRGQADYYWGPSRVWNNGSTWEQNYNAYVGYYNDMLSQMQTWQARANSAWGPSRVWPNGESWEAAYNRVQVPDPPVAIQYSQGVHMSFTGSTATSNAIYTDRPGRWVAYWSVAGNIGPTSDDQTLYCSAYLNGINQGGTSLAIAYYRNTGINWAFAQYRDLNAGDYIQVSSTNTYWCSGDLTFFVGLYFVPTAGRWH